MEFMECRGPVEGSLVQQELSGQQLSVFVNHEVLHNHIMPDYRLALFERIDTSCVPSKDALPSVFLKAPSCTLHFCPPDSPC